MNKKKLSVVMAGAMLASSVAPVLAATESKVDQNELGSLVEKVYNKVTETLYTTGGASVYGVKVNDVDVVTTELGKDLKVSANKRDLFQKLQEEFKDLTAGDKVVIYSKGFTTNESGEIVDKEMVVEKYTEADLTTNATTTKTAIINALANDDNATLADGTVNKNLIADEKQVVSDTSAKTITIYFNETIGMDLPTVENPGGTVPNGKYKKLVLGVGSDKYKDNLKHFLTKDNTNDGNGTAITQSTPDADTVKKITGFVKATKLESIEDKNIEEITITGTENNFKTEDLYDGLMLTTKGHELLSLVRDSRKKTKYDVEFLNLKGETIQDKTNVNLSEVKGEYGFVIRIKDAYGKTTDYTVKGAQKATSTLASWLNTELAKVDILAGENRYATAVQIAKEQASIEEFAKASKSNIVLVNGEALVDGLAAAPLAAVKDAPVLLTEADKLPKETKEFIKELLADKSANELEETDKDVTVHLVGGRTVLSTSVEKELKEMGLKIKRYNGDNREETSLKVAEEIKANSKDEVFVVGAEGEADAMSISGVASTEETGKVSPIIVSKKGGLTDDALEVLAGKAVTVIGGELVVSKADYEALEENVGTTGSVRRIAGANRQATNAAIIKEFYHADGIVNGTVESVVVAKDGRAKKTELVDALTAANLAVKKHAPIVLAKESLSAEQLDAIKLRAKSSESLYQVGIGVERSVMETLAKVLGLSNLK